MNKIIFKCSYFTIRVKELLILLVLFILLFFTLQSCNVKEKKKQEAEKQEITKRKEEKIVNICDFTNQNINNLNQLLSRVDLCSQEWFKDFDDYIVRIEEQNSYLEKKEESEYKEVMKYQIDMVKKLKGFKQKQGEESIEELEKSLTNYKNMYDEKCGKGKIGKQT